MLSEEQYTRALELLADRAAQGLGPGETYELDLLLRQDPWLDDGSFERSAAAIALSYLEPSYEPLPPFLRQRMESEGRRALGDRQGEP